MQTYQLPYSEWIDKTKQKLDSLDETLSAAERRTRLLHDEAAAGLRAKVVAARVRLDEWHGRWAEAKHTASSVWDSVGEEIGTAWEAARAGLEHSLEEIEAGLSSLPESKTAKEGDTVFVHYTGRFADGTEFRSTEGGEPIEFVLGEGDVLPAIQDRIEGMSIGEATTTKIPVEEGFGARDESLIFRVAKERFPDAEPPGLGDRAKIEVDGLESLVVTVRRVKDDVVEVDANHPLAGHDLTLDLQLVGIA